MDWWRALGCTIRSRLGLSQKVRVRVAPAAGPAPLRFELLPEFAEWTAADVRALQAFYQSATGRKLVLVCGAEIHKEAMAEAAGDRTAPRAHGMDWLLRFQFNLASEQTFARVSGEQDTTHDTAGKLQDELAPAEPRRSF